MVYFTNPPKIHLTTLPFGGKTCLFASVFAVNFKGNEVGILVASFWTVAFRDLPGFAPDPTFVTSGSPRKNCMKQSVPFFQLSFKKHRIHVTSNISLHLGDLYGKLLVGG